MTKLDSNLPSIADISSGRSPLISCSQCNRFKFHYVASRQFPTLCLECATAEQRKGERDWNPYTSAD